MLKKDEVTQRGTSYASQNHSSATRSSILCSHNIPQEASFGAERTQPGKCRFARMLTEIKEAFGSSQCTLLCLSPWHRVGRCPDAGLMRLVRLFWKGFACRVSSQLFGTNSHFFMYRDEYYTCCCYVQTRVSSRLWWLSQVFLLETSLQWHARGTSSTACVSTTLILWSKKPYPRWSFIPFSFWDT